MISTNPPMAFIESDEHIMLRTSNLEDIKALYFLLIRTARIKFTLKAKKGG